MIEDDIIEKLNVKLYVDDAREIEKSVRIGLSFAQDALDTLDRQNLPPYLTQLAENSIQNHINQMESSLQHVTGLLGR